MASCCTVSTTLPDASCNFCGFVLDFSQGPSSNSHSSVQHYHRNSSTSLSCNFRSFVLHCQHNSFPDPSCNFRGFMRKFSPPVFHVAVTALWCTVNMALLIINLLFVSYLLIACHIVQLLKCCMCLLSSYIFTCSHFFKSCEISHGKYVTQ